MEPRRSVKHLWVTVAMLGLFGPAERVPNDSDGSHNVPYAGNDDYQGNLSDADARSMREEDAVFERITIGLSVVLAGLLLTWVVVNAGVGMKAPDIDNETWLNSVPLHLSTTSLRGIAMATGTGLRCISSTSRV